MINKEVRPDPNTAECHAEELRELAKRAELYRINKAHRDDKNFSFRSTYFEEAERIIS